MSRDLRLIEHLSIPPPNAVAAVAVAAIEILEISIEIGCLLMEISIKHLKISIEI